MTVYKINRSHQMAYMVGLLILALALATVLVLAGEGNAPSQENNAFQQSLHRGYSAAIEKGEWGCAAA